MKITLYTALGGRTPIIEFINGLDARSQAKIARAIDLLEEFGLALGKPYVKKVRGDNCIWELRVRLGTDSYRLLFCLIGEDETILLHGFTKKTEKIPSRNLDIAINRRKEFINRRSR